MHEAQGKAAIHVDELLLDLALAFPGIDAERRPPTALLPMPKAVFSNQVLMADGCPVYLMGELPGYTDGVNDAFRAWLQLRGWNAMPSKVVRGCALHLLLPDEVVRAWSGSATQEAGRE